MLVFNCTVLIESHSKEKLIAEAGLILNSELFAKYNPKAFLVLEEIQEGISNISFQFYLLENQSIAYFEEGLFKGFINSLSQAMETSIQCFLTPLEQIF
jgi:hypothetical protein